MPHVDDMTTVTQARARSSYERMNAAERLRAAERLQALLTAELDTTPCCETKLRYAVRATERVKQAALRGDVDLPPEMLAMLETVLRLARLHALVAVGCEGRRP